MDVFDKVRVIVYRFHEKGLEIFLQNTGLEQENWNIPFTEIAKYKDQILHNDTSIIELNIESNENGSIRTVAIEGDWHDIPSIRKLIKEDVKLVASKIQYVGPELEKGTYVAIKETFKKVLPNEYKVLHELKDILLHRNLLKNL